MMPAVTTEPETPEKRSNPPRRGIYLLPNLLTTGCLFSGFYSIVAAIDRNFAVAGGAVFIAMVFDGLDGRVARWTRTESPFGKEYDSLADMVAFGVAPAVLVYQWGVVRISEYGHEWRQFGWIIAFFYALCAALRLARFNIVTRHAATSATSRDWPARRPRPPWRLRVVLRQVARAGTAGTGAGLRRHRLRRGAHGVLVQLPQPQAGRRRQARQVFVHRLRDPADAAS